MTATLSAGGVPRALALSATVISRVMSIVIIVPIGYFFYHKADQQGGDIMKHNLAETSDESSNTNS
jgi:hypothetical protein